MNDDDSTFGEASPSASTSIRSSITRYEWRHGRRYHAYQSGAYPFPNDEREQDRLDMLHHAVTRLLDDRLFLAPIQPNGMRILDIGTGTGLWPIQMGDSYPGASITGNDLSPIQPTWVPANVNFLVDDVELDWVETSAYDYIHCRYMSASIKDWPRLIRQIHSALKPGGWVEFQEFSTAFTSDDGPMSIDYPCHAFTQLGLTLNEACNKTGRMLDPTPYLKRWSTEEGFKTIEQHNFKVPIGNWPKDQRSKEVGTLMGINLSDGVDGMTAVLVRDVLGWSGEEVEVLNARVRSATRRDPKVMAGYVVVLAQKAK
ncbi:TAM domain methyltransferase [Metarhizium album ARSEF 1941]|uniref:TAM domain methyltransferase n=1 Tax=Metarhizium album (strain ARSEF 1941) TaxID=1081103 RepID=A0A0B2X2C3_METAS|nr:TAM domain methyltransferase [Metarhizium album ARSEF 1941]KHN99385.1 TAM domain methyltransferase [Metarhizium album ARSEF 1941]